MKKIKIYKITEPNGEEHISYAPPLSDTNYMLSYWLIAELGKTLKNQKTGLQLQSVTIPSYRLRDWEEVDI